MEILESDNGFAEAKNEEVQNENVLSNFNIYRKLCYYDIFLLYAILSWSYRSFVCSLNMLPTH